jgi:hypothetical protein
MDTTPRWWLSPTRHTQTRHVLADDDLARIIETAKSSWVDAIVETFRCFGIDLTDPDGPQIAPWEHAIPTDQWDAIATACGGDQTDSNISRVNHMLDWMNKGPSSYNPEGE